MQTKITNVKKANKTAKIHVSCHVVGYLSDQGGGPVQGLLLYSSYIGPEPRWEKRERPLNIFIHFIFGNELAKLANKG